MHISFISLLDFFICRDSAPVVSPISKIQSPSFIVNLFDRECYRPRDRRWGVSHWAPRRTFFLDMPQQMSDKLEGIANTGDSEVEASVSR